MFFDNPFDYNDEREASRKSLEAFCYYKIASDSPEFTRIL